MVSTHLAILSSKKLAPSTTRHRYVWYEQCTSHVRPLLRVTCATIGRTARRRGPAQKEQVASSCGGISPRRRAGGGRSARFGLSSTVKPSAVVSQRSGGITSSPNSASRANSTGVRCASRRSPYFTLRPSASLAVEPIAAVATSPSQRSDSATPHNECIATPLPPPLYLSSCSHAGKDSLRCYYRFTAYARHPPLREREGGRTPPSAA
eukprot:scaffold228237_cov35-Tisochrysis_lutea.AAC.1